MRGREREWMGSERPDPHFGSNDAYRSEFITCWRRGRRMIHRSVSLNHNSFLEILKGSFVCVSTAAQEWKNSFLFGLTNCISLSLPFSLLCSLGFSLSLIPSLPLHFLPIFLASSINLSHSLPSHTAFFRGPNWVEAVGNAGDFEWIFISLWRLTIALGKPLLHPTFHTHTPYTLSLTLFLSFSFLTLSLPLSLSSLSLFKAQPIIELNLTSYLSLCWKALKSLRCLVENAMEERKREELVYLYGVSGILGMSVWKRERNRAKRKKEWGGGGFKREKKQLALCLFTFISVEQILQRCPVVSDGRFVYKKVSTIGDEHYYGKARFLYLENWTWPHL